MTKNNKSLFKGFRPRDFIIPIVSAILGSLLTLLIFPIQKNIEQSYWKKQNEELVYQKTVEKRLELLGEFIEDISNFKYCSMRIALESVFENYKQDAMSCYHENQAKMMSTLIKIRYSFPEEVSKKTLEISDIGSKYEAQVFGLTLDTIEESKAIEEFHGKLDELIVLMKSHIYTRHI